MICQRKIEQSIFSELFVFQVNYALNSWGLLVCTGNDDVLSKPNLFYQIALVGLSSMLGVLLISSWRNLRLANASNSACT